MSPDDIDGLLEKPTSLQDILDFREHTYSMLTREAIALVGSTLTEGVNTFFGNRASVNWTSIEPVDILKGFVRVTGFSLPIVGTVIKVSGEDIEVSNENVLRYKQIVRFVLPIKLIVEANVEAIVAFMKDLNSVTSVATEAEIESILKEYYSNDLKNLTTTTAYCKMLDRATKPQEILGFDGTVLTDAQITAIHTFQTCSTEIKN